MRKIKLFCLSAALIVLLASCASEEAQSEESIDVTAASEQDIQDEELDLNSLKPEDMYTELFAMRVAPEKYEGRLISMEGLFTVYQEDPEKDYKFMVVTDEIEACCGQGLEFIPAGDPDFPEDYPDPGTPVRVTGRFEVYDDEGDTVGRLTDAKLSE